MAEMSGYDGKNLSSSPDTFDYVIVGAIGLTNHIRDVKPARIPPCASRVEGRR